MNQSPDLSELFADFAFDATFEDLPASAILGAKKTVLDTVGVILAASGMEPAVRGIIDFAYETGGAAQSSILAFSGRVPAIQAALANGAMAHCLDYDDQTPWGQHAASSLIPTALALAEKRGSVSGKQLLTAVAVGQDLFNRLRRNVDWRKEWMFSTVGGVYCAAIAGCRILGLSKQQMINAQGIASMQSCGLAEVVNATGSDLRAMYAGFPAKGATLAALLAEKGVSGVPGVFEAKYGVMNNYFHGGYDRKKILAGLGAEFTGGLTLYKRWPAVGTAHSHMHAVIGLVRDHKIAPSDIDRLEVFVGDYHQLMCDPIETRRAPKTLVDAKFSLPYLVAVSAVRHDLGLSDFTAEGLNDDVVLSVAQKVIPVPDTSLDWRMELPPGKVRIITKSGKAFDRVGTGIPGSAEAPMNWDDLVNKFSDCAKASVKPFASSIVEKTVDRILNLEAEDDSTAFLRDLT